MRDGIKNYEYFNEFIIEETDRIKRFETRLANGAIKPDRVLPVKMKIHDLKLGILIAKYSRGDSVNDLKNEYLVLAQNWKDVYIAEYYIKSLWMISLGVLFNLDRAIRRDFSEMLNHSDVHDWLLVFLLHGKDSHEAMNKNDLLFPDVYGELKNMILDNSINADKLREYILGWYEKHCSCGWHDSHKSNQKIYYGYWSFEAGAVAKIFGIEDDTLRGQQYYPYDLVHFH